MEQSQADQAAMAQGRAFVWHEITTSDVAGSIAFYTGALDFGTMEMPMGEMGNYTMLTRDGVPVCGVTQNHSGIGSHWATYLAVDDVDAKIAAVESLGAKVVVPAMDIPTIGRMAMIQDPQGAYLWLFRPSR